MKQFDIDPETYDSRAALSKTNEYNMWNLEKEIKRLADSFINEETVVADLGSGTFTYERYFNKAKRIYALEMSKKMIEFGLPKVKNIAEKLIVINEDVLTTSKIPKDSIDVIFAIGLFDYIDKANHQKFFEKCNGILKKSGLLVISTPNKFNIINLIYHLYCFVIRRKLGNIYSVGYLKKTAHSCNFLDKEVRVFGTQIWLPDFLNNGTTFLIFRFISNLTILRVLFQPSLILLVLQEK